MAIRQWSDLTRVARVALDPSQAGHLPRQCQTPATRLDGSSSSALGDQWQWPVASDAAAPYSGVRNQVPIINHHRQYAQSATSVILMSWNHVACSKVLYRFQPSKHVLLREVTAYLDLGSLNKMFTANKCACTFTMTFST